MLRYMQVKIKCNIGKRTGTCIFLQLNSYTHTYIHTCIHILLESNTTAEVNLSSETANGQLTTAAVAPLTFCSFAGETNASLKGWPSAFAYLYGI